jgi:hypothetical protein
MLCCSHHPLGFAWEQKIKTLGVCTAQQALHIMARHSLSTPDARHSAQLDQLLATVMPQSVANVPPGV